jgi:hypothetical protein
VPHRRDRSPTTRAEHTGIKSRENWKKDWCLLPNRQFLCNPSGGPPLAQRRWHHLSCPRQCGPPAARSAPTRIVEDMSLNSVVLW